MPRVACVTGIGAITPLGPDAETSWRELLTGRVALQVGAPGLAPVLHPYPVGRAVVEPAFERARIDQRQMRRLDIVSIQALAAAQEALADAGLAPPLDQFRAGVVMGIGFGAAKSHYLIVSMCLQNKHDRMSPFVIPAAMPNCAASNISIAYGTHGPAWTMATACAAGLDATGTGLWLIQSGQLDLVIAGGTESIADDVGVGGMCAAKALAKAEDGDVRVLRPFDRRRKGTAVGEGAVISILEAEDFAARRGARVRARLTGYAAGSDAYHITAPRPDGSGAVDVMARALQSSGLEPGRIGAIFAHGTGTPLNDVMEGIAVRQVFGERCPLVTSTKGQYGHAMGASGPMNLLYAVRALEEQLVPATIPCTDPDPECRIVPVLERPAQAHLEAVMVNAFGFGGHNASLILEKA